MNLAASARARSALAVENLGNTLFSGRSTHMCKVAKSLPLLGSDRRLCRSIGDCVRLPADVAMTREATVEHAIEVVSLVHVAVDGVWDLRARKRRNDGSGRPSDRAHPLARTATQWAALRPQIPPQNSTRPLSVMQKDDA
jgi:hypothetical protein